MIEIRFIHLITPEGQVAGHARVQGGFVDVRLRNRTNGQALVLTKDGQASGAANTRIRADGRVTAVAVHDGGRLLSAGIGHGETLSLSDVRRHIDALTKKPAAMPPPAETRTETRAEPLREENKVPAAPVPTAQKPAESSPRRSARHAPATPDVLETLTQLSRPDDAAFFAPEKPPEAATLRLPIENAQTEEDARAASLQALLERADAVFHRIGKSFHEDVPPLPVFLRAEEIDKAANAQPEQQAPVAEAFVVRDVDAWSRAVDAMLESAPPPAKQEIDNPFPHIFPGARFVRDGECGEGETLLGGWEQNGESMHITAVRGEYSPQPPASLPGFTRYIRTLQGGFWVRVEG